MRSRPLCPSASATAGERSRMPRQSPGSFLWIFTPHSPSGRMAPNGPRSSTSRREPAGARVLEDERRPAGQRAMGADQLARLDVLVRARQVLAGQMVAGIAEPRGQAAVVVHRRQPEEGGQDEPAELEEQRHDATFAGSWSIAARRAAMLAGVVPQQPPTAAAPASTSATA